MPLMFVGYHPSSLVCRVPPQWITPTTPTCVPHPLHMMCEPLSVSVGSHPHDLSPTDFAVNALRDVKLIRGLVVSESFLLIGDIPSGVIPPLPG